MIRIGAPYAKPFTSFMLGASDAPPWVIPKGRLLLPTKMETSAISRRYLLEAMV